MSKRSVITTIAIAGLVAWGDGGIASTTVPQIPLPGSSIPQFVDPVPVFGPAGIPRVTGSPITVTMDEFQQQVLPAVFPATWVWGYNVGGSGDSWPGVTIEAQRGVPTTVTYVNNLPSFLDGGVVQGLLTVDQTIHWADPFFSGCFLSVPLDPAVCFDPYLDKVPAVTHLHGAEVQSDFDGTPEQWFTPDGLIGPAYSSVDALFPTAAPAVPGQAVYEYPNGQESTTLWFHDHALGITRLNVFGGLAAFYLLRDTRDTGLVGNPIGLPAGAQEIELVIQDRQFDTNGQLFFPDGSADGLNGPPPNPTIHPFWIPELLGDVVTVNGKSWPFLNVEPRRYRFRFLNGSNARFYEMFMVQAANGQRGPAFWQIGTDGGLLDSPVELNDPLQPKAPKLLLGPGERADVVIDFAGFAGQTLVLRNTARTPFPKGVPPQGSTVGRIMQLRVGAAPVADTTCNPATNGCTLRADPIVRLADPATGASLVTPDLVRELTLNEFQGPGGPIELLLNNTKWSGRDPATDLPLPGSQFLYGDQAVGKDTYTLELPRVGSTEEWDIINVSADAHPIHLHLIQFQLLNRQSFNANNYTAAYEGAFPGGVFVPEAGPPNPYNTPNADGAVGGNPAIGPFLQGRVRPPEPNEAGWKDTVIMLPGEVTRILARYAPQDVAVAGVNPGDNLFPFDPTAGPGYVWHCHILDHEDNEMMHPYAVQP